MSVKISKNKITMTRGDTLRANIAMTDADGNPYIPKDGDSIRFALKTSQLNSTKTDYADSEPLIVKSIPTDTLELKLDPSDTKPLGFGTYVYDIEITYANGDVDTFITTAEFTLTPEVY